MLKNIGNRPVFVIMVMLLLGTSCSKYQKLLKSTDNDLKLQKAIEYYEKEDYHRSIGLFTDVIPAFRGTQRAEEINYYYAMAHYKVRDYVMASHYFRTFTQAYPMNEHAEEFLFLAAYCKYLDSPRPSLDQSTTREAISEFQIFINRYPSSERVEEANRLIDELRDKQEKKVFDQGKLYFDLMDYVASVTTFNVLIRDYPDTKYREEALFNIVRANYEYARNSIDQKQVERYNEVIAAHQRLERRFPESPYLGQSSRLRDIARAEIARLIPNVEITENN
ncbi:MAG: outer membrane protein assembly factor BamD [Bacteroidales bacterium]|jgi:outer membrane protein assembly factor BamD|nr:outer membrane protein assembly factor BamD [Bacteroidales bacterium]NLM93646.1 outer membrane protein assembly factor BamD [Bacteroidales bacterium]